MSSNNAHLIVCLYLKNCVRCKLFFPLLSTLQLSRDKHTLEDKLQDMQQALDSEENKSKQEHRQRLKLESSIQDLDEKFDRESKVCCQRVKQMKLCKMKRRS